MTKKTDEQKAFEAQDAHYILNHPLVQNAFSSIRAHYVTEIENVKMTSDGPERDRLMMGLKNLKTLQNYFEECINTGKLISKRK